MIVNLMDLVVENIILGEINIEMCLVIVISIVI